MLAVTSMCVLTILITRSTFFGDTRFYESDIASYLDGRTPFAGLLDFGHPIWRPLGALLAFHGDAAYESTLARVHVALLGLNLLASLACVWTLCALLRLTKKVTAGPSILVVAAFVTTNGFVNLSRSGSPWLPGLTCVMLACCFTLVAERRHRASEPAAFYWIAAVLTTALAVVFWVPYVLSALAIICAGLLDRPDTPSWKTVWRAAIRVLPGAVLLVTVAYACAICARHITSVPELLAWIRHAAHGEARGASIVRFFFGFPRSFFILGDAGIVWKQFLFHDPFARMTVLDVAAAGTWILALFYGTSAVAGWFFLRDRNFRGTAFWAAAGVVPTIALAVLFEAGSVERYLALYPMVFVVIGILLASARTPRPLRVLLVLLIVVQVSNNLYASFRPRIDRESAALLQRITPFENRPGGATVYVVNLNDKLSALYDGPEYATRNDLPQVALLVPVMYSEVPKWRAFFAKSAEDRWAAGGDVWVSKRAWATRPLRQWFWAENDDPRIHWADVHNFVIRLDADAEAGGADGFVRVANTPANRARILADASQH
jgi:hypothetical protein